MDNKQKINCTVQSCKYNNGRQQICELNAIMVTPKQNVQVMSVNNQKYCNL